MQLVIFLPACVASLCQCRPAAWQITHKAACDVMTSALDPRLSSDVVDVTAAAVSRAPHSLYIA